MGTLMHPKLFRSILAALAILGYPAAAAPNPGAEAEFFSEPMNIIFGLIVAAFMATAIVGVILWLKKRKPPVRLSRAQQALEGGRTAKARRLLNKVFKSLAKRAELTEEEKGWLQEAHLKMASIFEAEGEAEGATQHYQAAFEAGLTPPHFPAPGLKRLAPYLAQAQDTREAALAVYLNFLDLAPDNNEAAEVYRVLESLGTFPDIDLADPKVTPEEINRITMVSSKVAETDPQRPWPHLSLGLAAMLSRNYEEALPHFVNACRLSPNQAVNYYWLGQACRLKPQPYLKGVRQAYEKFLQLSQGEAERSKRAEAAYYLGSSLLEGAAPEWSSVLQPTAEEEETLAEAVRWLERALAEGLTDGQIYFLLGQAHFRRGQMPEAATALKSAVTAQPRQPDFRFALGMVYLATECRSEAEQEFLQVLDLDPQEREARWALVDLYLEDQRWAEAAHQANDLFELLGPDYEVLGVLILALYNQGKYGEVTAKAETFRAFSHQTEARPIVYLVARSFALESRFAEAVEWYGLSQALEPRIEVNYYLGCALGHLERYDEALEALKPALESETEHQALAFVQQGHIFLKQGQVAAAQESYHTALALQPDSPEILYSLGVAAFHLGDLEEAYNFFTRCLEKNPDQKEALLGAGLVREAKGDIEGSIACFKRVIDLDWDNPVTHERLAVIFCQQGDYRLSLDHFLRLGHRATESDESLYHLGFTLLHEGEAALAVEMWSRLAARHPEDQRLAGLAARGKYVLGRQMVQEGRYAEAAELWEDYSRLFPEDLETRKNLAELYWRLALASFKDETPDFPKAKELLQRSRELDQSHWKYPYYLSLIQLAAGEFLAARASLEDLAEKFPHLRRIRYHLGLVLMLLGERPQGLEAWQAVAAVGGEDVYGEYATFALANEYIGQGDYARAVELLAPVWLKHPDR